MALDDSLTKSLLHLDTDFTDESSKTWTGNGGIAVGATGAKFGAGALQCGASKWIDTPDHADWYPADGNFTADMWLYPSAINQNSTYVCGQGDGADVNSSWNISLQNDESIWGALVSGGTLYIAKTAAGTYAANTLLHIALERYNNTLKIAANGAFQATTANVTGVTANNSAYKMSIGRLGEYNGLYYLGAVDEFRWSLTARYGGANFTPPTAPYAPLLSRPQIIII